MDKEQMEKALETIYNWADSVFRHKIPLSFAEIRKIKDIAAIGLGLTEDKEAENAQ